MDSLFTPDELRALIRARGWPHNELARHWDISPVYLSRLINSPKRRVHWNDAFSGLPKYHRLGPELAARHARVALLLEAPQPAKRGPRPARLRMRPETGEDEVWSSPDEPSLADGYRYRGYLVQGAILTVGREIGELAQEGDRGIVFAVSDTGIGERYGIVFESGFSDWFLPHHIDACLAETGLVAADVIGRKYEDRTTLKRDYDAGILKFW
ncbi:hypothetical protein R70006_04986 [Paraburkholderia domus]|uniref:hypothetical protein n=1 Tax=Paraburkholderia domus TaxID=2793075 RepID=UPI00191163A0|nr:hypothetical protein [Paraburkholderia domus]MBK5051777.1 hypothetical protein [Burkholderia sp. R-70006]CAE6794063.1 hypothetical protein R70006_04986 [Paraburkholderia domus]